MKQLKFSGTMRRSTIQNNHSMKKLLLLLLLSLGFMGSAYADAVCRDGWASASEGSGTCSWHKGGSEWTYDGSFEYYNNDTNPYHRHGIPWLPAVQVQQNNNCVMESGGYLYFLC